MASEHVGPDIPNPGSDAALKLGCKCPVLDNARGRGHYGVPGRFVISSLCPVHGRLKCVCGFEGTAGEMMEHITPIARKDRADKYSSIYHEEEPRA